MNPADIILLLSALRTAVATARDLSQILTTSASRGEMTAAQKAELNRIREEIWKQPYAKVEPDPGTP